MQDRGTCCGRQLRASAAILHTTSNTHFQGLIQLCCKLLSFTEVSDQLVGIANATLTWLYQTRVQGAPVCMPRAGMPTCPGSLILQTTPPSTHPLLLQCSAGRPARGAAVQDLHWDVPYGSAKGTNTWSASAHERGQAQQGIIKGKPSVSKVNLWPHPKSRKSMRDAWWTSKMKSVENLNVF